MDTQNMHQSKVRDLACAHLSLQHRAIEQALEAREYVARRCLSLQ